MTHFTTPLKKYVNTALVHLHVNILDVDKRPKSGHCLRAALVVVVV